MWQETVQIRKIKMTKNNIIMVKLDVPRKVTLPNGRTLYAKYKRVKWRSLPANIRIIYTYTEKENEKIVAEQEEDVHKLTAA